MNWALRVDQKTMQGTSLASNYSEYSLLILLTPTGKFPFDSKLLANAALASLSYFFYMPILVTFIFNILYTMEHIYREFWKNEKSSIEALSLKKLGIVTCYAREPNDTQKCDRA